jgi:hypothetical protein
MAVGEMLESNFRIYERIVLFPENTINLHKTNAGLFGRRIDQFCSRF